MLSPPPFRRLRAEPTYMLWSQPVPAPYGVAYRTEAIAIAASGIRLSWALRGMVQHHVEAVFVAVVPVDDALPYRGRQARTFVGVLQKPLQPVEHFRNGREVDDRLRVVAEQLAVLGGVFHQHTRADGGNFQ